MLPESPSRPLPRRQSRSVLVSGICLVLVTGVAAFLNNSYSRAVSSIAPATEVAQQKRALDNSAIDPPASGMAVVEPAALPSTVPAKAEPEPAKERPRTRNRPVRDAVAQTKASANSGGVTRKPPARAKTRKAGRKKLA
jgi:hypothetical protein